MLQSRACKCPEAGLCLGCERKAKSPRLELSAGPRGQGEACGPWKGSRELTSA